MKMFKPRDYQKIIVQNIFDKKRSNIWAGMGMGKTSSTLFALDTGYMSGEIQSPTLVIAPLRVAQSTWPDEVAKWGFSNLAVQSLIGDKQKRERALANKHANIFTVNYENIPWLVEALGEAWPFEQVIADESTKLKNFRLSRGGVRAGALKKVAFKKVKHWHNLTGTPSPNGLIDLWGQNWFIDGGARLGRTIRDFTGRWFDTIPMGDFNKLEPRKYAQEQIEQALSDVSLSLRAEDWFDIEKPIVNKVYVNMPDKVMAMYKKFEKEMFVELEGLDHIEALNAAAKTTKCLQIASGAVYTDDKGSFAEVHTAKIDALESILSEANGMPILVAYHFKHDVARILKHFKQARVLDNNPDTIRDWNAGKIPMLVAHPDSAGHGLNLQDGGNILVYFSHWWNLESSDQILERIGPTRQKQAGYDRPVFVYEIIVGGTLDGVVIERKETKRSVQDLLIEHLKKVG